jgi:aminopeptidase-like protein
VTIKAVPNPFGNKVRFMITMEEAGNGVLEIYNIQGQKIKTVFQGYVPAGTNFYDLTVPSHRRAELIYIFRKGTEQFSGKLLQLDKN